MRSLKHRQADLPRVIVSNWWHQDWIPNKATILTTVFCLSS